MPTGQPTPSKYGTQLMPAADGVGDARENRIRSVPRRGEARAARPLDAKKIENNRRTRRKTAFCLHCAPPLVLVVPARFSHFVNTETRTTQNNGHEKKK